MRVYTSKDSYINYILFTRMIVIYLIIDVAVFFNGGTFKILSLPLVTFIIIVMLVIVIREYSFVCYAMREGTGITSYMFKKKMCSIHTGRTIYYKIFEAYEGGQLAQRGRWRQYIIFSNEPFKYGLLGNGFFCNLHNYDKRKQILIPYDEDIKKNFLEMEYWYAIEVE